MAGTLEDLCFRTRESNNNIARRNNMGKDG